MELESGISNLKSSSVDAYPDIDARVAQKLHEKRDLDLRAHEDDLHNAFQRGVDSGIERERGKHEADLLFAFVLGALAGMGVAAIVTWLALL